MLAASDLARMRAAQATTFDLTATVSHPNFTDDGEGGRLPAAATTFAAACRLAPHKTADGEMLVAERFQGKALWDITFATGTDIHADSTITIGARGLEVASRRGPHTLDTALVVLCVER